MYNGLSETAQSYFTKWGGKMWFIIDQDGNKKEAFRSRHEAYAHLLEYGDGYDVQEVASCALQEKRREHNMTATDLAEASGVSVKSIRAFECGFRDIRMARVEMVLKLANALDCTIEELI